MVSNLIEGTVSAFLAKGNSMGLIGKLHLSTEMSVEEVQREIRSVFCRAMDNRDDFPFVFLQPTGVGSRSLTIPAVSASFMWTAQQVARLKTPIYILAQDELVVTDSCRLYRNLNHVNYSGDYIFTLIFTNFQWSIYIPMCIYKLTWVFMNIVNFNYFDTHGTPYSIKYYNVEEA